MQCVLYLLTRKREQNTSWCSLYLLTRKKWVEELNSDYSQSRIFPSYTKWSSQRVVLNRLTNGQKYCLFKDDRKTNDTTCEQGDWLRLWEQAGKPASRLTHGQEMCLLFSQMTGHKLGDIWMVGETDVNCTKSWKQISRHSGVRAKCRGVNAVIIGTSP